MKDVNVEEKANEISNWLRKTVTDAGFTRVVIGVSGGVDSATSLFLAVKALGKDNVYALLMPYGMLSTKALQDGKLVARSAGLEKDHVIVQDIKKVADKMFKQVGEGEIDNIRKGNIMARLRMVFLYDMSKQLHALVVGTENLTEHYLGYFTRFGDEASDIEPIRNLYKTQVWEMAKYLGVPKEIIEKAPSANLWEGQSDEGEFGFSYLDADRILYHFFEEHVPEEGIVALGLDRKLVENVLQFVAKNDFKHHLPRVMEER